MPEHTIAENLARLQAAKTAIGNAIVAKGGTVTSGDGLEEYPADIASIETAELTSISITANGVYDTGSTTSGYNHVDVNVPNTYSSSDEGKVVSNRQLIPQTAKPDTIIANNTYDTTNYNSVTVDVENSYTASDEGKVVDNGALVSQTAKPTEITVNDTYDTTMYNSVTVDVANTYTQSDEGKVVSNGELVAQTTKPDTITSNNTYVTTLYNSVTVDVPNTYTQSDEGKVVNNGTLVAQTAMSKITSNNTYDTTMYNSVTVDVASEPQKPKDVNFYDYDDTIVKSYTAAEFANISELPDNPSHEGLTSQGWNWSLVDAKAHVAKYGKLNIGQMYVTSDGKTRLYITLTEGRTSPILQLLLTRDNSELDIDWGDGSHSTFTTATAYVYVNERHNYATAGDYIIAITVITGGFELQSSASNVSSILWNGNDNTNSPDIAYNNAIKKIEIGTGISGIIGRKAFNHCYALASITIPNGFTSISDDAFYYCYSLSSITIPNTVTSIRPSSNFYCCYSLSSITIPNSVTSFTAYFSYCSSLSSITIPDSVTESGISFNQCHSLSSITIPDTVTTIRNGFLSGSFSLSSVTIPDTVTSIGSEAFSACQSLSSITIPDGVTSIGDKAFQYCYSLTSITIGNSVTTIGAYAFNKCTYMESIKFTSTTPPTVSNSNAWTRLPTTCIIYVPAGTLNAYKTATNYPNPSTYTYIEY